MIDILPFNAIVVRVKTPTELYFENQFLKPALLKQQRLQHINAIEKTQLTVNNNGVTKSNNSWAIPALIAVCTLGLLALGYSNMINNKDDDGRQKN